jgi:hypothetical protein
MRAGKKKSDKAETKIPHSVFGMRNSLELFVLYSSLGEGKENTILNSLTFEMR